MIKSPPSEKVTTATEKQGLGGGLGLHKSAN